jgi:predicted nucleotidyltransferase
MQTIDQIKELIRQNKDDLRLQYGVREIGIFGSFAKGTQKAGSDLDILIEFEKPIGFVRFMRLESRLSELFGIRVELVTKNALKPYIGQRILRDVIYV